MPCLADHRRLEFVAANAEWRPHAEPSACDRHVRSRGSVLALLRVLLQDLLEHLGGIILAAALRALAGLAALLRFHLLNRLHELLDHAAHAASAAHHTHYTA
jgi:hypothetical protein